MWQVREESREKRYRLPIDVKDDGGAWYVSDGSGGIDEQKIENWLVFEMTCSMALRKSVIGWSRITLPRLSEEGRLKIELTNKKEKGTFRTKLGAI